MSRPTKTSSTLKHDLTVLSGRAHCVLEWAEPVLRQYYQAKTSFKGEDGGRLHKLHDWIMVPLTLWPLEICDLMRDSLVHWQAHAVLSEQQRLVIDLLPEPPDEEACEIVARHEQQVQTGAYENLLGNAAKYAQMEGDLKANPEFQTHWTRIKSAFAVKRFADHKGVIRRTMGTERNLRPEWPNRQPGPRAGFQTTFDAFCMRWNLYGMQHDAPLLLKLSVNLTPFATMIVVPACWSLDSKRDIHWKAIARLHRSRARVKQGAALKEGKEQRRKLAARLAKLDAEVVKRGLRGETRHAFLIERLGLPPGTSDRSLRRLRQEFRSKQ
jgi:hypothetical protein